jgi:hypothetical protein
MTGGNARDVADAAALAPWPEGDSALPEPDGEKADESDVCAAYRFDERAFARYVLLRNPSRLCFRFSQMGT